jgi:DNA-binding CsgD family transcriptional regulator
MKPSAKEDRQAIMQVIEAETTAYLNKNYEAWSRCWVHGPQIRHWGFFGPGGIVVREGWEDHGERMRQFMAANPMPSVATIRREAINLNVGRDMAWVTYDQHASHGVGPEIDVSEVNNETRVMVKDSGGWKIAYACTFQRSLDHIPAALIRVNRDGVVNWMNSAAKNNMREARGVVVRGGRLRAINRSADQRLQSAIRWAGQLDDGLWPRRGTLPIVLHGGHGEPASVCWVVAESSTIHVALSNQAMMEKRLAAAAPVYGITAAQHRLAALIVAGHDLVAAAKLLGVSVNTTRTQLQRMFEKTGVRSQPALVRALLSVAAPLA